MTTEATLSLQTPLLLSMSCRLVSSDDAAYDASSDLEAIDAAIQSFDEANPRRLDALDLFAGQGSFQSICKDNDKACCGVDILMDPERHDILWKAGFMHILTLVCSIAPRLKSPG